MFLKRRHETSMDPVLNISGPAARFDVMSVPQRNVPQNYMATSRTAPGRCPRSQERLASNFPVHRISS